MLDLGGIKKCIGEIEDRIVTDRREKNRRQQQVVFLLDRIETHFQKQQEELLNAQRRIDWLEQALQDVASAVDKLSGQSRDYTEDRDEVLERVLDLDRKFHSPPEPASSTTQRGAATEPRDSSTRLAPPTPPTDHPVPEATPSAYRPSTDYRATAEHQVSERHRAERQQGEPTSTPTHRATPDRPPERVVSERPAQDRSILDRPIAERAAPERPQPAGPMPDRPVADRSVADRPVADRPVADRPVAERAVPVRPAIDRVSDGRASGERPVRPDFSPDIRAIKALLNRDSGDKTGRESA